MGDLRELSSVTKALSGMIVLSKNSLASTCTSNHVFLQIGNTRVVGGNFCIVVNYVRVAFGMCVQSITEKVANW